MSYILDALRKADAERERGSVPNIHAQPLAAALPLDPASRGGGGFRGLDDGTRRWLIGGAAVALAAIAALVLLRPTTPDAPAVAAPAAVVENGRAAVADEPLGTPAAPSARPFPVAPSTAVADVRAFSHPAPTPLAAPPGYRPVPAAPARPSPVAAPPRLPATAPARSADGRSATAVAATPPSTSAAATAAAQPPAIEPASPAAADTRIYQTRELPDDIRRELPVLTVGGATYSENAASRMLIINGQVFHENDRLAPELVLERIQLRSAVLRYKGLRYSIAY